MAAAAVRRLRHLWHCSFASSCPVYHVPFLWFLPSYSFAPQFEMNRFVEGAERFNCKLNTWARTRSELHKIIKLATVNWMCAMVYVFCICHSFDTRTHRPSGDNMVCGNAYQLTWRPPCKRQFSKCASVCNDELCRRLWNWEIRKRVEFDYIFFLFHDWIFGLRAVDVVRCKRNRLDLWPYCHRTVRCVVDVWCEQKRTNLSVS